MGINCNADRVAERMICHNVCGLTSNSWQRDKFVNGLRDFSAEVFTEAFCCTDDVFCFGVIESGGMNDPFNLCLLGCGECLRVSDRDFRT